MLIMEGFFQITYSHTCLCVNRFILFCCFQCVSLEGLGCDSVVLIASPAGFTQLGSQKGRQFLEENFVIVTDFIQYCRGSVYNFIIGPQV